MKMKSILSLPLYLLLLLSLAIGGCATNGGTGLSGQPEPSVPQAEVEKPVVEEIVKEETYSDQPAKEVEKVEKTQDNCFGLTLIGEVEPVTIHPAKMTLPARIDTGATTSSLDARDIEEFERDGKKWVQFTLIDKRTGTEANLAAKVSRVVVIKRHNAESQSRPVVKLPVQLGDKQMKVEFSLTDRSDFEYSVLVGRNLLKGGFAVDVNRNNTSSLLEEE